MWYHYRVIARALVLLVCGLAVPATAARLSAAQAGVPVAGEAVYARYCASCHGPAGEGDGPASAAFKSRPPDLSRLAARNDGIYPAERVREAVLGSGRALTAHGSADRPVWGPAFRAADTDSLARDRVASLVAHIERLQRGSSAPTDEGARLFRTYCASCHGVAARGDGPVAEHLRKPVPDLTKYTARNEGVFPSERLRDIVDGRGVGSHGDRDMPVWGDAFRAAPGGLSPERVTSRVAAIVRYLGAIQERAAE